MALNTSPTFSFNANNRRSDLADEAPAPTSTSQLESKISVKDRLYDGYVVVLGVILLILLIPFYLLYAAAAFFFFGVNTFADDSEKNAESQNKGLYQKAQDFQEAAKFEADLISAIWWRVGVLSLIVLLITVSIPGLRNKDLLWSKLWEWMLLLLLFCCGYPLLSVATKMLLYLVCSSDQFKAKKQAVYYARGLRRSVIWIIVSGLVLVAWATHFGKRSKKVLPISTCTFVAAFVGALLCLLKNILLMKWKANAIYERFSERIFRVGFQPYFVALLDGNKFHEFDPSREGPSHHSPSQGDEDEQDRASNYSPLGVKHMSVLTTTFMKIGLTSDEMVYPNSVLATKSIVNLKSDPDDVIVLKLDSNSTTHNDLDKLQSKISSYLRSDINYENENHSIVVNEIGSSIKVMINYRHVLSIQEVTHTQCFEKKMKQRSCLLSQIKRLLDALNIKVAESQCH